VEQITTCFEGNWVELLVASQELTVDSAPSNGAVVTFSTTGALPTGLTTGTEYYVVNRTSTTFQVSATSGGSAITTSGTQSGRQTATWRTLVNTSGSQSGTQTETTSELILKYKNLERMSIDLAGNMTVSGTVSAANTTVSGNVSAANVIVSGSASAANGFVAG